MLKYLPIFLLTINISFAQDFAPIGAKWHYTVGFAFSNTKTFGTIESIKDTTINGLNCKELLHSSLCYNPTGYRYIHYSNDSLYLYFPKLEKFQLVFDFSAKVGDSWDFGVASFHYGDTLNIKTDSVKIKVDSISEKIINDNSFKQFHINYHYKLFEENGELSMEYTKYSTAIEFIGDIQYLFNFPVNSGVICDMNYSSGLRCYEDNNIGFYTTNIAPSCEYTTVGVNNKSFPNIKISPNPTTSSVFIENKEKRDYEVKIFSISGKILKSIHLSTNQKIDISDFKNGLYYLAIYENNQQVTVQKIVKN